MYQLRFFSNRNQPKHDIVIQKPVRKLKAG